MDDTNNTRFRITTWPGQPLPLPDQAFLRWGNLVDDEGKPAGSFTPYRPEYEGPYGEVYLRLVALDLGDDEAILEFTRRYGILGMYNTYWPKTLWDYPYFGFPGLPGFDDFVAPALAEQREELEISGYTETLSEFIWGAQCIKDMTSSWRVANREIEEEGIEWAAPCWMETLPEDSGAYSYWASPYWALSRGMQSGLQPFGPTVHFDLSEGDEAPPPTWGGPHPVHREIELPLYCIVCLELFNHMAEQSRYLTCANETCGRLFVRQQGRAAHGQHRRKGVKYCSAECARAQAQRQYRRRNAKRGSP